jgi:hypothetical protein
LVARGIVVRATEKIVKEAVEAHRNNVVAYTVALLVTVRGKSIDLEAIWEKQAMPVAVANWVAEQVPEVDRIIRSSAGAKNVGEWCKKRECWGAVVQVARGPSRLARKRTL